MGKFLKNEIIKTLHSKKILILLSFITFMVLAICYMITMSKNNIISNAPSALKYPEQIRIEILNMNSVIFLHQFSIEFVFRTVVPYFLFFMVIFAVETFGEDYFSGTMKHFIRLDKNRNNIFNAKVLSLVVYSALIVFVNLVLGFVISSIVFKLSFNGLGRIVLIYSSSIIPVAVFGVIIGMVSMYIKNKNISITLGILISIILTVSDRLTISSNFSPIGVLGLMDKVRSQNVSLISLLGVNITACIYLVAVYFIGKNIFKHKEFNY